MVLAEGCTFETLCEPDVPCDEPEPTCDGYPVDSCDPSYPTCEVLYQCGVVAGFCSSFDPCPPRECREGFVEVEYCDVPREWGCYSITSPECPETDIYCLPE